MPKSFVVVVDTSVLVSGFLTAYRHDDRSIDEYRSTLESFAFTVAKIPAIEPVCRDPDDDHVLAAGADCIVAGDADLLSLGGYGDIRIVRVRAFLRDF